MKHSSYRSALLIHARAARFAISCITCSLASSVYAQTVPRDTPPGPSASEAPVAEASVSEASVSEVSSAETVNAEASNADAWTHATGAPRRSVLPAWLPWTFAGLGAASALTSVVAWRVREGHVDRYNSPACLEEGRTRGQACSNDYYGGRDAEAVVWVTGISSVAFLGAALFLGQTGASVSADTSSVAVRYSRTF